MNFYETDRAVSEYLLFHYGADAEILPYTFGPFPSLCFPARCVAECLDAAHVPAKARALDLGCAVGRSTFELARTCAEVIGIDFSQRFIETARVLQQRGAMDYEIVEEGRLTNRATARVPPDLDRERVRFERGDAHHLRADIGLFDVVLLANLIDRLHDPRRCLAQLPNLLRPGGQLIVASPYTWLEEYTPRGNWLGGFERDGRPIRSFETLNELLSPSFEFSSRRDLPFLIREHARKFQWGIAEASVWTRL